MSLKSFLANLVGGQEEVVNVLEGTVRRLRTLRLAPADRAVAAITLRETLKELRARDAMDDAVQERCIRMVDEFQVQG